MFFYLSKVFWFFLQPLNLVGFLLLAGLVALLAGWRRSGAGLVALGFLMLALAVWTSLGAVMLRPLEDRFARPAELPRTIDGIIVLGGGFEGGVNLARGGYELNSAGDRMVETAVLARRFPEARVVVSGGTGTLVLEGEGDADTAPRLLAALGVEPERMVLENRSRDTHENAVFTRRMLDPGPEETWLLVTSAFHMPRSMALFEKAGFSVLPWPADYRTQGTERFGLAQDNPIDSIQMTSLAIREWIGLAAYRLTGRIDSLFPGPGVATAPAEVGPPRAIPSETAD